MTAKQSPTAYKAALCRRIQAARESIDMTQEQMAAALGIKRDRYSKYEVGRSMLPHHLIPRFCELTKHDPWYILTGQSAAMSPVSGNAKHQPESDFWIRLTVAMKSAGLPTTQMGVARKLSMSQGSVQRWVRGGGLPTLETTIELASMTGYCVEWLLTGRGPEKPRLTVQKTSAAKGSGSDPG